MQTFERSYRKLDSELIRADGVESKQVKEGDNQTSFITQTSRADETIYAK